MGLLIFSFVCPQNSPAKNIIFLLHSIRKSFSRIMKMIVNVNQKNLKRKRKNQVQMKNENFKNV